MKLSAVRKFRKGLRRIFYLDSAPTVVRRIIIGVIGGTILLIGISMVVLPGPAIVVVPLGLMVLATEFIWARRWLKKFRVLVKEAKNKVMPQATPPAALPTDSPEKLSTKSKVSIPDSVNG